MQNGAIGDPTHLVTYSEMSNLAPTLTITGATVPARAATSTWANWRYTAEGRRDLRWDAIRGLAVLIMLVDHLGGANSWLYILSGHDRFFISAAEPFIFVSGLVMGLVYSRLVADKGLGTVVKKALRRAATLYFLTVSVSLTFAFISLQLNLPWAPHWPQGGIYSFVLSIITFQRVYYLTDVLLLYTLLVLAAAPVIALLARGYTWRTLAASWSLWVACQIWPQRIELPWHITDNGLFSFAPWQALFFSALAIGFHRASIQRMAANLRARLSQGRISGRIFYSIAIATTGTLVIASIAIYLWILSNPSGPEGLEASGFFEKANVQIGRLAVFVPFVLFAFATLTVLWLPIKRALGWLLLPLGKNALAAFTLHLFLIALTTKVSFKLSAAFGPNWDLNDPTYSTLVQVIGIALVWLILKANIPIRVRHLYPKRNPLPADA